MLADDADILLILAVILVAGTISGAGSAKYSANAVSSMRVAACFASWL